MQREPLSSDAPEQQSQAATVLAFAQSLAESACPATDAERVDLLRALELLKCAAEGASLATMAAFDASQRAQQAAAGVKPERLGRGVASQIALARRESPHRAKRILSLARIAPIELPHAFAALRSGHITGWRLSVIAHETVFLSREHRMLIDAELASDPQRIEAMSDRDTLNFCQARAATLDPAAVVQRRRHAETERHVSLRPAPDTMTWFGALLPVAQGVAVYAALTAIADTARSKGDERSRGQIMADALTNAVLAYAGQDAQPAVTLNVTMSERQLFGHADGSAHIAGYGSVDAELARELAMSDRVRLRRLYIKPISSDLVAMEARARCFPDGLKQLIKLRDRTCRTPWCDAPIRHIDHVRPHEKGGPTAYDNGQGLCEACNLAKQADGWAQEVQVVRSGHTVLTMTPTGHTYSSAAPATAPRLDLRWVLAA